MSSKQKDLKDPKDPKDSKGSTLSKKQKETKVSRSKSSSKLSSSKKVDTELKKMDMDSKKNTNTLIKMENPYDFFKLSASVIPEGSIIPTPDAIKWTVRNKKWCKLPSNSLLGNVKVDDSVIITDPITFLPGEKCTCGRPKTEFEKNGIYTYGDYLKKCCLKGQVTNTYGKSLKFSDSHEGLGLVIRNFDRPNNTVSRLIPIKYKKSSNGTIRDAIIEF